MTHHPMPRPTAGAVEVEALEHRFRQRGLLVDDDTLYRLMTSGSPRRSCRAATSTLVEEGPAHPT
jgi:hypothetical protein